MTRLTQIVTLVASALLTVAAPIARAQPATEPSRAELSYARGLSRAFASVAHKLEPSVVHITQLNRVSQVRRDFFGFPMAAGPSRLAPTGLGSGVIVTTDGYILTNNHVAKGAESLVVRLNNQKEFPARLVGRDEATDLAVIKIESTNLPAAEFSDSDDLEVGEWVVAIGSPFGFSSSVTAGIVSAKGRSGIDGLQEYQDFIQTDAVINPGNSGGPLINLDGKIVGINSAIASRTGGSEGIGFAIPANVAKPVMQSLIKSGRVTRGWLGVELGTVAEESAGDASGRVRVDSVVPGSPAEHAGLRPGDVITAYQGRRVDSLNRLRGSISLTPPESTVAIDVLRAGQPVSLRANVGDQALAQAAALGGTYLKNVGLTVRPLTRQLNRAMGLSDEVSGVQILAIDAGGRADSATPRLQPGDIIAQVDRRDIEGVEDLGQSLARANFSRGVRLSIIRVGEIGIQQGYVTIQD